LTIISILDFFNQDYKGRDFFKEKNVPVNWGKDEISERKASKQNNLLKMSFSRGF
jgi:hypothetical protein